ncbi:putative pentatricopeptide repeat-containing protein, mitochondrial [Iris pallida]|uniref:Pentatricopeptide repeat-containing protein, mitochondrial n=1 Tax=Iris pallida TaxID=29817 RepID=A0AAX6DUH9_IRIPA|nr:putative pentatricopeptide repeat-containing protein, mitochondrial [Iris pallida]
MITTVLEACANTRILTNVKAAHGHLLRRRAKMDELTESSLVATYGRCGDLASGEKFFGTASERRSVVSWTAMISSYNQRGCFGEALDVCTRMLRSEVEPNLVTMIGVLYSCTQLGLLKAGKSGPRLRRQEGRGPSSRLYGIRIDKYVFELFGSWEAAGVCSSPWTRRRCCSRGTRWLRPALGTRARRERWSFSFRCLGKGCSPTRSRWRTPCPPARASASCRLGTRCTESCEDRLRREQIRSELSRGRALQVRSGRHRVESVRGHGAEGRRRVEHYDRRAVPERPRGRGDLPVRSNARTGRRDGLGDLTEGNQGMHPSGIPGQGEVDPPEGRNVRSERGPGRDGYGRHVRQVRGRSDGQTGLRRHPGEEQLYPGTEATAWPAKPSRSSPGWCHRGRGRMR